MKDHLPGCTEKSPFSVRVLFCLFSQIKHLLMHFCKLPRLALGPADRCLWGRLLQVLSGQRQGRGAPESWRV